MLGKKEPNKGACVPSGTLTVMLIGGGAVSLRRVKAPPLGVSPWDPPRKVHGRGLGSQGVS